MANAFTIYWGAKGWQSYGLGNAHRSAGRSNLLGKVSRGDLIYATSIAGRVLRLLGDFTSGIVTRASDDPPHGVASKAKEWQQPYAPGYHWVRNGGAPATPHGAEKELLHHCQVEALTASMSRFGALVMSAVFSHNAAEMFGVR